MQREHDCPPLHFFCCTCLWLVLSYIQLGIRWLLVQEFRCDRGVNIGATYICYSWLYNHFVPLLGIDWSGECRICLQGSMLYTVLFAAALGAGSLCYFERIVIAILVPLLCCRTLCSFRYLQHVSAFTVVSKCQTTGLVLSPTYSVTRHWQYDPVMALACRCWTAGWWLTAWLDMVLARIYGLSILLSEVPSHSGLSDANRCLAQ
jgi:hypothetical protein